MISAKQAVFSIATSGGELDISLATDGEHAAFDAARRDGLIKIKAAGWGDRTVAVLTQKGRELTGMPLKKNFLTAFFSAVTRRAS